MLKSAIGKPVASTFASSAEAFQRQPGMILVISDGPKSSKSTQVRK